VRRRGTRVLKSLEFWYGEVWVDGSPAYGFLRCGQCGFIFTPMADGTVEWLPAGSPAAQALRAMTALKAPPDDINVLLATEPREFDEVWFWPDRKREKDPSGIPPLPFIGGESNDGRKRK